MSQSNNESSFSKGLILGALIGGAVGAVTALLFAPKSGVELRRDLAEKSSELYDKTTDYLSQMQSNVGSQISSTVNEGKLRAQNIIDSAKRQAEVLLGNAESLLKEAKDKAMAAKDNVADTYGTIKEAAKASADTFKAEMTAAKNQPYQ